MSSQKNLKKACGFAEKLNGLAALLRSMEKN